MYEISNMEIFKPLVLKLHQMTLYKLFDYNWTGLNLYYYLKPHVRQGNLLNCKTKENGVLYFLTRYVYREFFYSAEDAAYEKCYIGEKYLETGDIDNLKGEELIWHIEYVLEMIKLHSTIKTPKFSQLEDHLKSLEKLYPENEERYFILTTKGKRKYTSLYNKVIDEYGENVIKKLENNYCKFVIDRLFFDRELCKYISELIYNIGLYGNEDSNTKSWISRKKTPDRIKVSLLQRESHSCAICKRKIQKSNMTIDHIIPLSQGGHNDIVNLQTVCEKCNLRKKNQSKEVKTSIPSIILKYMESVKGSS